MTLPIIATGLCVLSSYIYLFVAGENLPTWVYVLAVSVLGYSIYSASRTLGKRAVSGDHVGDVPETGASS
jgi:hypothetical protein